MTSLGLTLAAVLAASLLGSLHCVAMCGGFVATVSGASRCASRPAGASGPGPGRRALAPLFAYQLARGLAYTGLGALAGLLGAGLDASAAMVGIQRFAGPVMGVVLIAMAVMTLRGPGPSASSPLITLGARPRPSLVARLRLALAAAIRERGASAGAAAGLLSALLPCAWLWAYLAVAASTGSVASGSAVMAVFWLGSVPALLGVGVLAGAVGRRLGRHAPRITAGLLLGLGILSLAGKLSVPITAPAPATATPASAESEPGAIVVPHTAPCH
jgi:uncharacterized protein